MLKKNILVIIMLLSVMLLYTACSDKKVGTNTNSVSTTEAVVYEEFTWPTSTLGAMLPVPESNKGEVTLETSEFIMIDVGEYSQQQFDTYVDNCFKKGFSVDYHKTSYLYSAYNNDKYRVQIMFNEDTKLMDITIESPKD